MGKIEAVKSYKTTDGEKFEDYNEATIHQKEIDIYHFFASNSIGEPDKISAQVLSNISKIISNLNENQQQELVNIILWKNEG